MLRICVNPLSAGVQAMRARICSALSCDMFARVVYVRLWGGTELPTSALPFARTHSPRMACATNSCTRKKIFKRGNEPMHAVRWLASPRQGEKILLNDFCRAFGHSKARQTQSFFKYLHQKTHEIRKRISCVFYFTFSAYHHQ